MSTKTLRKRIALVAVSALGFGLVGAAPSSAVITTITLTPAKAAGVISINAAYNDDSDIANVYIEVLQSASSVIPVGLVTNADVTGIVDETEGTNETDWVFEEITTVGTYRFRVFVDQDADAAFSAGVDIPAAVTTVVVVTADLATPAPVAATGLAVTYPAADGTSGNNATFRMTADLAAEFAIERTPSTSTGAIVLRVVSAPEAALVAGDTTGNLLANYIADAGAEGGNGADLERSLSVDLVGAGAGAFLNDTAGVYSFIAYVDTDATAGYSATDVQVPFTITLVGASIAATGAGNDIASGNTASLNAVVDSPAPATTADVVVTARRGLALNTTAGAIKFRVDVSPDADLPSGTVISANTADTIRLFALTADGNGSRALTIMGSTNGGLVTAAGAYTITAWQDADADNVVDTSEQSANVSFTRGAVPALVTTTLNGSFVPSTGGTLEGIFYINDSLGRASVLASDALTVTSSNTTSVTITGGEIANRIGATNGYRYSVAVAAGATAGTVTITVDIDGSTTTTTDKTTTTFVIGTAVDATELFYNGAVGIKTGTSVKLNSASATDSMTVDVANTTIYFTAKVATADAGKYLTVTTAAGVSTASSAISRSGVSYVKTNADGTITFPVTFTGPVADDSYTLTVEAGTTDLVYTVTYAAVTPTMSLSPVANGGTVKAKYGDTLNMVATLTDQWLRPMAAKTVTITIPSTNRNPQTVSKTTDAAGKVTYTLTDAYAATDKLSDVVTFTYSYLATAAATAATNLQQSATVTYTATGPVVGTIAVTSALTDVTIDQAEEVSGTPVSSTVVYTATVKDANGVAAGSGILVTFTAGANDIFLDGVATGVTGTDGTATVTVYRQKTGFAAVAAAAGGKSGSALPVKWVNTAADARNIAIAASPASLVSAATSTITATVTDRWGNGVSGIAVTFAELGAGRLGGTTGTTNAAGIAAVDFTSNAGETGTNSVSATMAGGQSANLAGFVGTAAVAGVTAGNATISATVTITADTSTSTADALLALATALGTRDQASAAVDAAAEATDAANAATDAANAAAEAADAATAAAQDAADAVAALSTQVSEMVAALKKQITSLTNLVIKIQKKVKA